MLPPDAKEPYLGPFEFYVEAFKELTTCRPVSLGQGPIPFTAIADYHTIYNVALDLEDFLYVIRRMDLAYLKLESKSKDGKK